MESYGKEKKEEYKTYKELKLGRDLKSKFRRERINTRHVNRVIGGNEMPFLEVNNQRYLAVRAEVTRKLLNDARDAGIDIPIEALIASLRHRIERMTYDRLALEMQSVAQVESAVIGKQGRHLTYQEKQRFIESAALGLDKQKFNSATTRAGLVDDVLAHIQQRQGNNPARYQAAWAQAVGPDIAQQTQLDKVDAASGTAYFRCYNSVLSYQLQRQFDLPKKLTKALGTTIRQVRVRH
jgi:hypothetical protein